jgi:hypothetical protein
MKILLAAALILSAAAPSAFAYGRLHPTPAGCSNAGDETARPVYDRNGKFLGYECVQDNRGGGGGRVN